MKKVRHYFHHFLYAPLLYLSVCVCPPDDLPRKKSPQMYKPPTPEMLAYLDFSVSTTGILAGVKVRAAPRSCYTIYIS